MSAVPLASNDLMVILDSLFLFGVTVYQFIIITNSLVNMHILFKL